jgi:hypothetical protein
VDERLIREEEEAEVLRVHRATVKEIIVPE